MKILSDTTHVILDYLTVALFGLAPSLFGFSGASAIISYALAGIHLAMTLFTNMPLGVVKIIPMKLHAFVEMLVGPVLVVGALAVPALVIGGRGFFIAAGILIFVVWLLSHYGPESELRL